VLFQKQIVIPAKVGIHRQSEAWIPAFAGVMNRSGLKPM